MEMKKTTIKLDKQLKKLAEKKAIETETTLQDLVNEALYEKLVGRNVDKLLIKDGPKLNIWPLDENMDNLKRGDFYE
jgi:hypothetical protein